MIYKKKVVVMNFYHAAIFSNNLFIKINFYDAQSLFHVTVRTERPKVFEISTTI